MHWVDSQVSRREYFASNSPDCRLCSLRWRHAVCCQKNAPNLAGLNNILWTVSSNLHSDLIYYLIYICMYLSGQFASLIFHTGFCFTKKRSEKWNHLDKTFVTIPHCFWISEMFAWDYNNHNDCTLGKVIVKQIFFLLWKTFKIKEEVIPVLGAHCAFICVLSTCQCYVSVLVVVFAWCGSVWVSAYTIVCRFSSLLLLFFL